MIRAYTYIEVSFSVPCDYQVNAMTTEVIAMKKDLAVVLMNLNAYTVVKDDNPKI